ncbi:hypothetical protein [Paracoccus sp. IB05]|uniref:hypothetical protein n=1 Tax=Paracoccus sp. IB05 TaxID=2779367 RepID=UPI0018E77FB8|nr:hypothetical protein [Paracoccus sp. IB05]MBJ2150211.1 hypothetical protein [Paracoccus sp. IB05]
MAKRIALLSNCLANQNAKVAEYEVVPGALTPVLALLRDAGFTIRQMPCPEMTYMGCGRWWQVRAQYDTPGYRNHCTALATGIADLLAGEGAISDLVFLGVDGSPSSGVSVTDSGSDWGGRPGPRPVELARGPGVWSEILAQCLAERGFAGLRMIGIGTELPGYDPQTELGRLATFLASGQSLAEVPLPAGDNVLPEAGGEAAQAVQRSRRLLVVGDRAMNAPDAALLAFEAGGWGELQLPAADLPGAARILSWIADEIEDYLRNAHQVAAHSALIGDPALAMLNRELVSRGLQPLTPMA